MNLSGNRKWHRVIFHLHCILNHIKGIAREIPYQTMKAPQLPEADIRAILAANAVPLDEVSVVAIRGYYLDSMGDVGKNDRKLWDDAMFIVTPSDILRFQANTDPNGYRKGQGTGAGKGMAMLKTGIHLYGTGKHKGRLAFRQCEPFTVIRDGNPPYEDTGMHAINLHDGGYNSTSSLGCQTIPKGEWEGFQPRLYALLERHDNPCRKNDWGAIVPSFNYLLISETERRKNNLVVSRRYLDQS
jgi:lysozyme